MLYEQDETRRDGKATSGPAFPRKTSFKREIDAPDFDALKDLKACRREYEENEKGHNAKRYELLQRGARDARMIRRDDELWEKFADDPFWIKSYNGGKPRPQKLKRDKKSAVRYALIYMLRARTEEAKQLARKYARSVARHLENGVKIADLPATLSVPGNGIEDSSHANKSKAKAGPKKITRKRPSNDDGNGVDSENPIDIAKKRRGDDRPSNKPKGPIFRWDKKTMKAMEKLNKVGARGRLDFKAGEPKEDGRMRVNVLGVTERK
jgi:hypothetical protein